MQFRKGMKVFVVSDSNNNNYFEGTVYDYVATTGEITIEKVKNITGKFCGPTKYNVSTYPSFQELDKARQRIAALYEKVFGIDISEPNLPSSCEEPDNLDLNDRITKEYFQYFFGEDLENNDPAYVKTDIYLNAKVNSLYEYFFDVDLKVFPNFNPNDNSVDLDTLTKKIEQLNLYFFGSINGFQ